MKFNLILLMVITFTAVSAQDMQFKIAAGNKSVTVSPGDDDEDKLFVIDEAGENALTINIINDEIDKDWKRNFSIYDSADNSIEDFVFMKNGSYCVKPGKLRTKLNTGSEYFIYTIAIPKDPAKAMLVKVGRVLVCRIKIL